MGETLFAIIHFCVFNPIDVTCPTCVFFSFVDDMHIVGPTSNVVLVFLTIISKICYIRTFHLISKVNSLYFVGIKLVHIKKKIGFLTPNIGFHILGALMDFMPFVKSFVAKAFLKDFNTIIYPPMLIIP